MSSSASLPPATPSRTSRPLHLALFITGFLWLLASHASALTAAAGISTRFNWGAADALLGNLFLLFLLLVGFTTLNWIATKRGSVRQANALPRRATVGQEWLRGALIGWAALLIAVLPMMLAGALHPQFSWSGSAFGAVILSLISLAITALVSEVAFRGFLFRHLIDTVGPSAATLLLSAIYALLASLRPNATGLSFFITFIAGILFSLAYLRTHALWFGWGLHFTWAAATAVLFGLPAGGLANYASIIQTSASGPSWFTGGAYGPDAAFFTGIVFILAMAVVHRATRDYAWNYTHPAIIPGGYPMDVPPPAAHTAMENEAAARPQPLVQISPTPSNTNGAQPPATSAPPPSESRSESADRG